MFLESFITTFIDSVVGVPTICNKEISSTDGLSACIWFKGGEQKVTPSLFTFNSKDVFTMDLLKGNKLRFGLRGSFVESTITIAQDIWYHVCVTWSYNPTTGAMVKFYLNGKLHYETTPDAAGFIGEYPHQFGDFVLGQDTDNGVVDDADMILP